MSYGPFLARLRQLPLCWANPNPDLGNNLTRFSGLIGPPRNILAFFKNRKINVAPSDGACDKTFVVMLTTQPAPARGIENRKASQMFINRTLETATLAPATVYQTLVSNDRLVDSLVIRIVKPVAAKRGTASARAFAMLAKSRTLGDYRAARMRRGLTETGGYLRAWIAQGRVTLH